MSTSNGTIVHKTTRLDVEAAEQFALFKALVEYFRQDASVMAPEQVYRLFGVTHRTLMERGWLAVCGCGECGGLVPAGELARVFGHGWGAANAGPCPKAMFAEADKAVTDKICAALEAGEIQFAPFPPQATVTTSAGEELAKMTATLRVLREEIETHWQTLAGRMQAECWTPAEKEAFADGTRNLYRESEALNQMLFEKTFSLRWV